MTGQRRRSYGWYPILLVLSQVVLSLASPVGANADERNAKRNNDCPPDERPSLSPGQEPWYPTVYQIGDGQIQVSYSVTTVTSNCGVLAQSSVITSFFTYTPMPRQYIPSSSTSPSTTALEIPSLGLGGATATGDTATSLVALITSVPESALTSLTTSEVQTAPVPFPTNTSGNIHTALETSGIPIVQPFPSVSLEISGSISLIDTSAVSGIGPTATPNITNISAGNIFQAIATDAPPAQISSRSDHPVPRLGIQQQQERLQTNKFYANFFLGNQTEATWTHPYSITWTAGSGQSDSWGLAISHIERSQVEYGAPTSVDAGNSSYFANLLGIESLIISSTELGDGTTLTTDSLEAFSVNVNLLSLGSTTPTITFPLCQGIGFVTGVYNSATPLIQSGIGIQNVTYAGAVVLGVTFKYRVALTDGTTWLVYVTPLNEGYQEASFTVINGGAIQGPGGFGGYIQIAKVPIGSEDAEMIYDGSAGSYATSADLSGSVVGTVGSYTLSWTKAGAVDQPLLMFALPHHMESFAYGTTGITNVQLQTTTKGLATAVQADSWTLTEPTLPIDMMWNPWSPTDGDVSILPHDVIEAINAASVIELAQPIANLTNDGSMYFDGKALAKFAAIVYVAQELVHNSSVALAGLKKLEVAFAVHVNNTQIFPLVYDTQWGGVVSISTYLSGNAYDDFGNTYYNDHHFHYGYFLYAASVIAYLDPTWLTTDSNKAYIDTLARDYANPTTSDPYFPFSRNFDWYMGHSWATGLFPSADGKNQESSSEDTMASYAIKLWGRVTGDANMEARGNLMLAVQRRSLRHYFLYLDGNVDEPAGFVDNKVSGILFENKIDHTTFFGHVLEYIQGIHMLPLMPMSAFIRTAEFVAQEWTAYDFAAYAATVTSGWRGILMANLALSDAEASYTFFSNATGEFQYSMLDGGASQTWYLAWSGALRWAGGYSGGEEGVKGRVRRESVKLEGGGSVGAGEQVSELVNRANHSSDFERHRRRRWRNHGGWAMGGK